SVQSLFRLTGGNVLRLTTARWYTPLGRSIHREREDEPSREVHALAVSGQLVDSADTAELPEYRSEAGRILYGGGGIVPDLDVPPETLSEEAAEAVQRLFRRGGAVQEAIFAYAVTYVQGHPNLRLGFRLSQEDLDAFHALMRGRGLEVERADVERAEPFLRYHLEREIALQAWDEQAQFEQSLRYDAQLAAALELLAGVESREALFDALSARLEAT